MILRLRRCLTQSQSQYVGTVGKIPHNNMFSYTKNTPRGLIWVMELGFLGLFCCFYFQFKKQPNNMMPCQNISSNKGQPIRPQTDQSAMQPML